MTDRDQAADARVLRSAREVFGHEALRPGQAAAVRALLSGRDVLVGMPTGAGASLTYQLQAWCRSGSARGSLTHRDATGRPPVTQVSGVGRDWSGRPATAG